MNVKVSIQLISQSVIRCFLNQYHKALKLMTGYTEQFIANIGYNDVIFMALYKIYTKQHYCNNLIQKQTNLFNALRIILNSRISGHKSCSCQKLSKNVAFIKWINVTQLIPDIFLTIFFVIHSTLSHFRLRFSFYLVIRVCHLNAIRYFETNNCNNNNNNNNNNNKTGLI